MFVNVPKRGSDAFLTVHFGPGRGVSAHHVAMFCNPRKKLQPVTAAYGNQRILRLGTSTQKTSLESVLEKPVGYVFPTGCKDY